MPIKIYQNEVIVIFHVVGTRFSILKYGVLGHVFLRDHKAIIDIVNSMLFIATQASYNEIITLSQFRVSCFKTYTTQSCRS